MSICNDLTGLRWLRKYFKSRWCQAHLGPGSWAGWTVFQRAAVELDWPISMKPTFLGHAFQPSFSIRPVRISTQPSIRRRLWGERGLRGFPGFLPL
jgi:hypothetical protein